MMYIRRFIILFLKGLPTSRENPDRYFMLYRFSHICSYL